MTFNGRVPFLRQAAQGVNEHNFCQFSSFFFFNWSFVLNFIKGGSSSQKSAWLGAIWNGEMMLHTQQKKHRETTVFHLHMNSEIRF